MAGTLVLFMDDARADALRWMPATRRLARRGTTFTNAYSSSPVCMPSRTSALAGRYAQSTGIFGNDLDAMAAAITAGTWSHTNIGAWLAASGVQTMLVGKYHAPGFMVPPGSGWTRARCITTLAWPRGFDVRDETGALTTVGADVWHSTWAVDQITDLIDTATAAGDDWMVWWSTSSPHYPFHPIPGQGLRYADVTATVPPQHGTDWPSWITDRDPITDLSYLSWIRRSQARELSDIDSHLAQLTAHLADIDQLDASTIVVTSDNGLHLGDHRLAGPGTKNTIYEPACRIPLVAVGPDYPAARTVDHPAVLIDIAADLIDRYDATPTWAPDGVPLHQVVDPAHADRAVLVQTRDESGIPHADAVITRTDKLIAYSDGGDIDPPDGEEREGYRLNVDPGELVNVADDDTWTATHVDLENRLATLLDP